MWELIICPRSLSNSLCWEKNTNLMRRRYRRQDLPFPQTGNTAERNSSESREWAEKIDSYQGIDEPHMIADTLVQEPPQKLVDLNGMLPKGHFSGVIDHTPGDQRNHQLGNAMPIKIPDLFRAGTAEQQKAANHQK